MLEAMLPQQYSGCNDDEQRRDFVHFRMRVPWMRRCGLAIGSIQITARRCDLIATPSSKSNQAFCLRLDRTQRLVPNGSENLMGIPDDL
jgi:hypothetical protein